MTRKWPPNEDVFAIAKWGFYIAMLVSWSIDICLNTQIETVLVASSFIREIPSYPKTKSSTNLKDH